MPIDERSQPVFHEEQRFRQRWLWVLLISVSVAPVVMVGGLIGMQICLGRVCDKSLAQNPVPALVVAVLLVVPVFFLGWFWKLTLTTEVHLDGVHVQFRPFPLPMARRFIAFVDIDECCARTYRPLVEFGGWGIRYGWKGMAYNVSGNRGVQLVLRNGRKILIGSQQADDLAAAITDHLPSLGGE